MNNWVLDKNALPLLMVIAHLVNYELDHWDHDALEHGLEATDAEAEQWLHYPIGRAPTVDVRLARDPGTAVIHVSIDARAELRDRIALAIQIGQQFELTPRS